jgi:hypothetical protein
MKELPIDEDPIFDDEVRALLTPGNPKLLRGLRPETLRAMGLAPRASGARWMRAPMIAIASAAALIVLFLIVRPHEKEAPSGDLARMFYGDLESSRGAGDAELQRTYSADGTLRVEISQPRATSRVAAGVLKMFEVDVDHRLRPLQVLIRRVEDPSGAHFTIEGRIRAVFETKLSGTKKLAFVVGGFDSDLSELAGEQLSAIQAREDLRCFVEEISILASPAE